jgi:hypothetical protein
MPSDDDAFSAFRPFENVQQFLAGLSDRHKSHWPLHVVGVLDSIKWLT